MAQQPSPVTRLWALVREERSDITAIYFFAVLGGLIQLSLPLGIQGIIGFVLGGTLSASLVVLITVVVIAVLFTGVMHIAQMRVIERIQQRIFIKYAFAFAERIPRLDLIRLDGFYLPELVNRFFDTSLLQKSLSKLLIDIPTAMIQIFFGLVLLSFYHPFFILFGVALVLTLWVILYLTGSKGLHSSLAESTYKYSVAGWLEEMARMIKTFKVSASSGLHLKKADERTVGYLKARTTHFSVLLLQYKTLVVFKVAVTAAMLIAGVTLLLNQQINIGQFVAAEIIIIMIISAVEKTIVNLDGVYDVLTAVEKVSKLTDKPVEVGGTFQLSQAGSIGVDVHNLTFGYEPQKHVLNNLSFSVSPGQKVCITGKDGSGKSTLLRLLLGVYSDFTGSIALNQVPIGNYEPDSLRERTGMLLPQENVFNGTLWENITMGRPNIDQQYVSMLAMETGLQPFIASLPRGYDTELDATGKKLPRNVVQKIVLIRALAHRPSLLILEEPWEGLEDQFKKSIRNLLLRLQDTTVFVATTDETFARECDQTISLHP